MSRLLVLVFFAPTLAYGQLPEKYRTAIQAIESQVERERVDGAIPGLSIAVVDDQSLVWARGFGHASLRKSRPATGETVYRVGSVSKLFTDIAVMQLAEEGKLDIDAPLTKYLPEFKPDNRSGKEITLRHLMTHRSGLVREPPIGSYFDPEPPSLEKTVTSLNGLPLTYPPETKIKYSNAAIAVVGRVVEKVDGRPFAEAVRERVLKKFRMNESDFELTPAIRKNLSDALMWTYHGREFPAPTFELGEAPAGCMYSTVTDLGMFMSAMFEKGRGVITPASLDTMLTLQFAEKDQTEGFGLGFAIGSLDGKKRIGHGGAIYGFSTELAFLPEEKLGVVVIANKDVTNRVTTRVADMALRAMMAARAGKQPPKVDEPKAVSRETARKLAGRYGAFELLELGGKLYAISPNVGYVAEIRQTPDGLISHGLLGAGTRFECDGKTLTILPKKGEPIARQAEPAGQPPEPPESMRGLIGEYGWDHNVLYIFERHGKLHALIEWFFLYPLEEVRPDVYKFPTEGGLYHGEELIFQRNRAGKAVSVEAARVVFKRRPIDGEDGQTFRIKPERPVVELRKAAVAARPPDEGGDFLPTDLVELTALDPTIKTDLRYATDNNFLSVPLYPKTARALMQRPAAEAVVRANKALARQGYGLWVYDAYRPWHVTKIFWDATPEKHRGFVADPAKGSRHNRGCAVDLTLYDLKMGKPVEMVGGFDEFSDRSYPQYWGGTSRQRWHRELLRRAMEDAGFSVFEAEWWHFDYKDWRRYRIGNQDFAGPK